MLLSEDHSGLVPFQAFSSCDESVLMGQNPPPRAQAPVTSHHKCSLSSCCTQGSLDFVLVTMMDASSRESHLLLFKL